MLADLITKLHELFKSGQEVKFYQHTDIGGRVFVQKPGGVVIEMEASPPMRLHEVLSFDSLVRMINDEDIATTPEAFVGAGGVKVFLDGNERRDVVTLTLRTSQRWDLLWNLEESNTLMQPREVVKMLRFNLHTTNTDDLQQSLRRITFSRSSAGKSHIEHGKESLGRKVEAEVQQQESIPQEFTVTVPVWSNARYKANVICGVHLDLEKELVMIRPLADELDMAMVGALDSLASDLAEACEMCRVYVGHA